MASKSGRSIPSQQLRVCFPAPGPQSVHAHDSESYLFSALGSSTNLHMTVDDSNHLFASSNEEASRHSKPVLYDVARSQKHIHPQDKPHRFRYRVPSRSPPVRHMRRLCVYLQTCFLREELYKWRVATGNFYLWKRVVVESSTQYSLVLE